MPGTESSEQSDKGHPGTTCWEVQTGFYNNDKDSLAGQGGGELGTGELRFNVPGTAILTALVLMTCRDCSAELGARLAVTLTDQAPPPGLCQ